MCTQLNMIFVKVIQMCTIYYGNWGLIYIVIILYTNLICLFGHMGRAWLFTYGYGHSVWEVAGSCLGYGTIVGGVLHPARQLERFSPPNMKYILNLFRISLHCEAINYRPYVSPSFEVASHFKNCCFGHYYYYKMFAQKII